MSALEFRLVDVQRRGEVAVLSINDPPANTLTYDLIFHLENVFFELALDSKIRAVVLSGAGERFFSGGVNIGMLRSVTPHFNSNFLLYASEVFEAIDKSNLLVVAAINGHVTGGGLELALVADKRIAVEGAYNFGFPEVRLGVIPGLGGTQRLSRIVGPQKALELITHGDFISVHVAQRLGIVDAILPKEGFLDQAVEYARALLAETACAEKPMHRSYSWAQPRQVIVDYARTGSVGVITLTDACKEVSSIESLWALNQAILKARLDNRAEAILLTHTSDGLALGDGSDDDAEVWGYAQYVFARLEGFPRLCILAFNGILNPLATELALACDYRLVPEGNGGGDNLLTVSQRSIRQDRYDPHLRHGLAITRQEATDFGLVRTIDGETWPQSPLNWVERFLSPRGASKAIGYAKFAVIQGASLPTQAGMLLERHLQEQLFRGHDAIEGMKAYLEKRSAIFKGE